MPRSYEVQSGPEDSSEAVDYSDAELVSRSAAEDSDSDYDGDRDTRRDNVSNQHPHHRNRRIIFDNQHLMLVKLLHLLHRIHRQLRIQLRVMTYASLP